MNSTLTGTIATYLAQVKAELADLPPGELEDVLDDVASHLTEVAAEFEQEPTESQLWERLGAPRQYADELRTAAGYPASTRPVAANENAAEKSLRWAIIAAIFGPFLVLIGVLSGSRGAVGFFGLLGLAVLFVAAYVGVRALGNNSPRVVLDTPRGRHGAEFVRGLIAQIPPNVRTELVSIGQPVWWVARGALGGGGFFALFGAGAVAVVGAIAGAGVSIWIGRRSQQDRRWLWYVVPLNVIAILSVPAVLAGALLGTSNGLFSMRYYDNNGSSTSNYSNGLVLDGESIQNVYPFDEQGRQVSVRLYTDGGRPINLPVDNCAATYGDREYRESNLFPLATIESNSPVVDPSTGETTSCTDTTKAPFVPPPAPATPTVPTTTPTPGTTPGPTSGPTTGPTSGPATGPTSAPTSGPTATPPVKPTTTPTTPGVTLTVPPPSR
ncbi:DUF1700 domain-containing protein [Kribbella sp. DT2]|uniref:DUF1700 domain-containing protein n=1 Tax=Kribbella sp. DT2 TaxID=3393427 RepID=UPI003CE81CFE